MSLSFVLVCDLLEQAHKQCEAGNKNHNQRVSDWFTQHRRHIDDPGTDASALLSTLLPDKRTDRVYAIQADALSSIISRALRLGASRVKELRRYKEPGRGEDLADCVARILKETPNPIFVGKDAVTVEEIDSALNSLAASCRFSSPAVRASQPRPSSRRDEILGELYLRVQSREAKWLTRLILKSFQPVLLDPGHVYHCYDPLLPNILKVRDDFSAALSLLQNLRKEPLFRRGMEDKKRDALMKHLTPVLGVKVGRPYWLKGRGIKHCMKLGYGRMSCEKKIDGEYCQIHIDLTKGFKCIQIFSKSGKDSTNDRAALHGAIRDSLNIGKPNCKLVRGCILEGELVVYSDKEKKILPFHKIRKYVSRSGSFINTEADSQRHNYEHLMIIYYDVLLIDQESLLGVCQSERFKRLAELIACREGHAEVVDRQVINFDHSLGAHRLRQAFAKSITGREEGLVLKPDDPYFDFSRNRRAFSSCPIKLKKEYISGFGDVGDFAVVAARYDPTKAKSYNIPNLKWTHFYLGCLENKEEHQRCHAQPRFTVVHQVELSEALLKTVVRYANPKPVAFQDNDALILNIAPGIAQQKMPSVAFTEPLVFDIRCFSFDQEGNTGFWQPRFPQVSKVHFDRSFTDTISFSELQAVAEDATKAPAMDDSQEMLDWIARLEGADPRGIPVDAVSQSTTSSRMTPSRASSTRPSASPAPSLAQSPLKSRRSLPTLFEALEPSFVAIPASSSSVDKLDATEDAPASEVTQIPSTNKRILEGRDASPRKRSRVHSEPGLVTQESAPSPRHPLADMSVNQTSPPPHAPQTQQPAASQDETINKQTEEVAPVSDETSKQPTASCAEPPAHNAQTRSPAQPKHTCQCVGEKCFLTDTAVLLSPCVAQQPWITENLLPIHGIHQWATNPQDWVDKPPVSSTSAADSQRRRRHIRRVCFVEHNRREVTHALMKHLENNPQYTASGRRGYVEVYDWRILEDITALERKPKGSKPATEYSGPKQKWWVGLA
ncbi:ATP dependent DNA ligase domain-containing protein [Colletotrichum navitas]|uniref:ATP dependent DNA ligase domain-containing protein n=1 Tax=Colletotrichum navitas TaxID=681940 RepID=A0AAD8VAS8_9PEZI|nr:ATP dependent DNA ligase domain-containing protein [Colletotrichum navitas]KAK1599569.1 ATP dependent DNA ligase domain-containing protein [Colletotrichum navitas]